MQLLSLAALGPDAQRMFDEFSYNSGHDYRSAIVVFLGITFALWIVAAWFGAQAVGKKDAGPAAAVVTGFQWMAGFLFALVLAGAAWYFAKLRAQPTMAAASVGIGGILLLYTAVSVPMKVHRLSLFKGIAFASTGLIVHGAAQLAVQKAMGDPVDLGSRFAKVRHLAALPPQEASEVLAALRQPAAPIAPLPHATPQPRLASTVSPTPAPKPAEKTIAERHDELKKVYADLVVRREALQEGEDAALAAYTRDTAHYVELLAQLQKDYDAQKNGAAK